ncbi:MAG: hypothetical protein IRZ32_02205 [Solirubrobacteraceae bacterium]|nr:hypothetical protein [Solirubrobacteraceae bacterium]
MAAADDPDAPTGLPDPDAPEPEPLGPPDADPDGAGRAHGEDAMPGIPREGEEGQTDG